jgi:hypothetical protein
MVVVYTLSDARDWYPILLDVFATRELAEADMARRMAGEDRGYRAEDYTIDEWEVKAAVPLS